MSSGRVVRTANVHILTMLEKVADGQRRSDRELQQVVGQPKNFLKWVYLIPWLQIDRTAKGTVFTIDVELRDISDDLAPRPVLNGFTVRGFLKHLRAEIVSRRKANKDAAHSVRWNPDAINKREQSDLLDWVEDQLGRIPS